MRQAREHLIEVIDSTQRTGEPVYLTRRGRPVAVVIDPIVFEKLLNDAEDALDRVELAMARDEDDDIPWEQVKADLGLGQRKRSGETKRYEFLNRSKSPDRPHAECGARVKMDREAPANALDHRPPAA